jgi:hypothetical protein
VQRNKRSPKINCEGGVSPCWEGGRVPSYPRPPPGKMLEAGLTSSLLLHLGQGRPAPSPGLKLGLGS